MNRTALIIIWLVAVLAVCGLLLADIRESEGQEMIIPDGFDLWIDDDTVLAIPGGYVRSFAASFLDGNLPGGAYSATVYTVASDEMVRLTLVSTVYVGTVPAWIRVVIDRSGTLITLLVDRAPVTNEDYVQLLDIILIPGDLIVVALPGSTLNNDLTVDLAGYQWKGVGQ